MSPHDNMDKIEKKIVLKASRERVWRAISDARNFGVWFGVDFDGPFVAGQKLAGRIVPTQVDPEVAKMQEPYKGTPFEIVVETILPMERFAFRWHPFAADRDMDYSKEPMTLVTFLLEDATDGVLLTITESGFEKLSPERRAEAFTGNEGGWEHQTQMIDKYLSSGRG